jgi:hypothetical protein
MWAGTDESKASSIFLKANHTIPTSAHPNDSIGMACFWMEEPLNSHPYLFVEDNVLYKRPDVNR